MRRLPPILTLCVFAWSSLALAGPRDAVFSTTKHGDAATGVNRTAQAPRGHCMQCHTARSNNGPQLLFTANDNALCFTCHQNAGAATYLGQASYTAAAHSSSSSSVWPGPTPPSRAPTDQGKCVNCHTPHGTRDGQGLVPDLSWLREEALCLACHDSSGPAQTNIAAEVVKAAGHPTVATYGVHSASESGPAAYGVGRRHAECTDCHNPHRATGSERLSGVTRVRVTNGTFGTVPTYTVLPPADSTPVKEYEVCFKCHSSWTSLPDGGLDKAVELNPAGASFHPVEAPGTNASPAMTASLAGGTGLPHLTPSSVVSCSDCHASDSLPTTVSLLSTYTGAVPTGPHGSNAAAGSASNSGAILRAPYRAELKPHSATNNYAATDFTLCFICHSSAPFTDTSEQQRSDTDFRLHGIHVSAVYAASFGVAGDINTPGAGQGNVICRECHYRIHGTATAFQPTDRNNQRLVSFAPNVTGTSSYRRPNWSPGLCELQCHGKYHDWESY